MKDEPNNSDRGDTSDGRASNRAPRSTQFKKGQSGNPSGRPKIPESNLASELRALMASVFEVRTPRGRRLMSREEAFVRKIVADAFKCEQKAFRKFLKLAKDAGELKDLRPPFNPMVYFKPTALIRSDEPWPPANSNL